MVNDNTIQAVHDDDLEDLLRSLGVLDSVLARDHQCLFCNELIDLNNIFGILPINNEIVFCCNKPKCRIQMASMRNNWDSDYAIAQ